MKALLICPADRPAVARLAENAPLAATPLLGRTLIEYWIAALAAKGTKQIIVLAADRPHDVRSVIEDGTRWGVDVELIGQTHELTVEEARSKYGAANCSDVIVMDYLPGLPNLPLFESYAGWFAALQAFLPRAQTPDRIGTRQIRPGVWVGLHAQISPNAQLLAPCWIGECAIVGDGAVVGPNAIVEDRAIIEHGARIADSVIGPETFVGQLISVENSLANGSMLVNWQNDSCVEVPDAFFLCSLRNRNFSGTTPGLPGRMIAAGAMLITAPAAMVIMLLSFIRGDPAITLRLGVRPHRSSRHGRHQTFIYYELTAGRNWLRRWPQFWSVVRGDFRWVGNRPLRPAEAMNLSNDFERLWLAAPIGLVSLADAHGCIDMLSDETIAHSSYYTVNATRRLDCFIMVRTLCLAAANWPIRWSRRKPATVALPELAAK
jgi:hypothetical protein